MPPCPAVDRTFQLMWRLSNGELPQVNIPKLVLLLIGTNDLGFAFLSQPNAGEAPILAEVDPLAKRWARFAGPPGFCTDACCLLMSMFMEEAREKLGRSHRTILL